MANIQKTLDALQPYVIGIRYLEGTPIIDAVFKDGWTLPDNKSIKKMKGNDEMNYFMIFSDEPSVGIDDLLEYVELVIKLNQEREKKHELLREKIAQLKEVFKTNSLNRLKNLRFSFNEEDEFETKLDDIDLKETEKTYEENEVIEEEIKPQITDEMSDEEKEMLEEEARAERNRQILKNKNSKPKVELPPKKKVEFASEVSNYDSECDCGPDEACGKCIDKKDF